MTELNAPWCGGQGKAVQKYVEELIEADIKFLAFGVHRCILDSMCFVLNRCAPLQQAKRRFLSPIGPCLVCPDSGSEF